MKILFVVNNLYATANGLSASARRTVRYLKDAGMDVRVLSGRNWEEGGPQPEYVLPDYYFPVFNPLILSHGYHFAQSDVKVFQEALSWCDVVHLEEPFGIQYRLIKYAEKMGKPITGTYHLHPENMFASVHLHNWHFINHLCLHLWVKCIFNHCKVVTFPTENCMKRLRRFHLRAKMKVISNGVEPEKGIHTGHGEADPFIICCIGRLAVERNQKTLIRAMKYSKYADRIELHFAGRGPRNERYFRMAERAYRKGTLKYRPVFEFLDKEGLKDLASRSDLYIHCATVEVEGLSCIEALRQGVVPIIADAHRSGTTQFALDDRSIYRGPKNARQLARKIDWWLDHPKEMKEMSDKYIEFSKSFDIHRSIDELVKIFRDVCDK
ncbi:MAG: glycosyltransferase [Bacteroidales bacterium]|nr:glycosyltransferase [Bacteroidales bacterium]